MQHPVRLRVASRRLTAAAGLAVIAAIAASLAGAAGPPVNGKIAFSRYDESFMPQIWVANPDFSNARKIGPDGGGLYIDWSPDAKRLVFDSDRLAPGTDHIDVFSMKPDGSDVVRLTGAPGDLPGFNGEPSYSPDGKLIAFEHDDYGDVARSGIWVMRADGSGKRQLTVHPGAGYDLTPRFSPDGKKIAFSRHNEPDPGRHGKKHDQLTGAVHIVNVDGEDLHRITSWKLITDDVDWSPDGRWIVFATEPTDLFVRTTDVFVVKPNGDGLRNLTQNPVGMSGGYLHWSSHPSWSPDGSRILYLEEKWDGAGDYQTDFWSIGPDGSNKAVALASPEIEDEASWGTAPAS